MLISNLEPKICSDNNMDAFLSRLPPTCDQQMQTEVLLAPKVCWKVPECD